MGNQPQPKRNQFAVWPTVKMTISAIGSFLAGLLLCNQTGAPVDLAILAVIVSFTLGQETRDIPVSTRIWHTLSGFLITVGLSAALHHFLGPAPAFFLSLTAITVLATLLGNLGGMGPGFGRIIFRSLGAILFFPSPMIGHLVNFPIPIVGVAGVSVIWNLLVSFLPGDAGGSSQERTPSKTWDVTLLRASQQGLGMLSTLVIGYWLLPHEVPWAFITAYLVSIGARTRGELIVKSGSRFFGAVGGALVGIGIIPFTGVLGPWIVPVCFSTLILAAFLRQFSYLWWAAGITFLLTVLYSLLDPAVPVPVGPRLLGITLGAVTTVCASLVIPLPTRRIVQGYLRRVLVELDVVLSFLPEGTPGELNAVHHNFERQVRSFYELTRSSAIHLLQATWYPASGWAARVKSMESLVSDLVTEAEKEPHELDAFRVGQLRRNNGVLRKQLAGRDSSSLEELKAPTSDSRSERVLTEINRELRTLYSLLTPKTRQPSRGTDKKNTLEGAVRSKKKGRLEQWVHSFLTSPGGNPDLSTGLKCKSRNYFGPVEIPIDLVSRCCGPEPGMKYSVSAGSFAGRVDRLKNALLGSESLPPLLVNYSEGVLTLNDGNHRHEAQKQLGRTSIPVIVWTTGDGDMKEFKDRFGMVIKEIP